MWTPRLQRTTRLFQPLRRWIRQGIMPSGTPSALALCVCNTVSSCPCGAGGGAADHSGTHALRQRQDRQHREARHLGRPGARGSATWAPEGDTGRARWAHGPPGRLGRTGALHAVALWDAGKVSSALRRACLAARLSPRQAKRTNIGIALVTNPRVLFLGEPWGAGRGGMEPTGGTTGR